MRRRDLWVGMGRHRPVRPTPVISLLELEVSLVYRAITQCQNEFPALVGPRLVRLPDIDELIGVVVVVEARKPAVIRGDRISFGGATTHHVNRCDARHHTEVADEISPAGELELHWDALSGLDEIGGRRVVYRLEETSKIVFDRKDRRAGRGIVCGIRYGDCDCMRANADDSTRDGALSNHQRSRWGAVIGCDDTSTEVGHDGLATGSTERPLVGRAGSYHRSGTVGDCKGSDA